MILKKLTGIVFTFAVFGLLPHVQAASFDCEKAGNKIERTICQDPEISMLDEELSRVYKMVRVKEKQVVKEQRAWLKIRNKCADSACLKKIYSERVAELVSRGALGKAEAKALAARQSSDRTSAEMSQKTQLSKNELGRVRSAGACIGWAEEGNRILRRLGKSTNFNDLIRKAELSVRSIENQAAVRSEIRSWSATVKKGLQGAAKGDLRTEQIMAMGFLKECAEQFYR
ncbi:lysozyme inhibitor LprI family protein [Shewanella sp.]|uniref:lysozyme inhibitor LprI family protein n=1 Tax=Shewanella sp. TaxID=50422 RepID=UPI004048A7FD